MCGFVNSLGDVPSLLFRMVAREQDTLGGDGVGIAYFGADDKVLQYKFIPAPTLEYFTDIYKWFDVESIGNTHDMFKAYNVLKEGVLSPKHSLRSVHTRRLTSGDIHESQTQPFVITENGITYVVCHKGTIYNYINAAEELQLGVIPINDSHMVALAISQGKELSLIDVIKGKAIVSFYKTSTPDEMYTFCMSDDIHYLADLFYLRLFNDSLIISTTYGTLNTISDILTTRDMPKVPTYRVPKNGLYKITRKGDISLVKEMAPAAAPVKTLNETYTPSSLDLETSPKSKFRLTEQNFIYHLAGEPIESEVIYSSNGTLLEVSPIIVTSKGYVLNTHLNSQNILEYYRIDDRFYGDETTLDISPVYALYFYKGILLANKDAAMRVFESSALSALQLSTTSVYPVHKDLSSVSNINFYYNRQSARRYICPLFTNREYEMVSNKKIDTKIIGFEKAQLKWEEDLMNFKVLEEV